METGLCLTLVCLALVCCAGGAARAEGVMYIDANRQSQTCESYTALTADTPTAWSSGWYAAEEEKLKIKGRVTVSGDVHLILCDRANLSIPAGITVAEGNSLTIYGQPGEKGELYVNKHKVANYCAGIGGGKSQAAGTITINGGYVWAMGGMNGAGIGGGYAAAGGTVTAQVNGQDAETAHYNNTVTLIAAPEEGFRLAALIAAYTENGTAKTAVLTPGTGDNENEYTFQMPAADVTVTAVFSDSEDYLITYVGNGDNVTLPTGFIVTASVKEDNVIEVKCNDTTMIQEGGQYVTVFDSAPETLYFYVKREITISGEEEITYNPEYNDTTGQDPRDGSVSIGIADDSVSDDYRYYFPDDSVTITYACRAGAPTSFTAEGLPVTLAEPYRTNYSFAGWYDNSSGRL